MPNPKTGEVSCPRCGQPVGLQDRTCRHCGIDLAVAAVLATEQTLTVSPDISTGPPITPEILVPRLGEILLERRLIKPDDLQRALERHDRLAGTSQSRLLGQILLDMNLIDQETLDLVITEQIVQLQAALQKSNMQLEERVKERTLDLQNALTKLTELNQLKSNFISNISHELRTPLTHIKGYLDLLADGSLGSLSDSQSNALDVMLKAEWRLEQLIEDLLRFSMASRGEFTLHMSQSQVSELVNLAVNRNIQPAKVKDIRLRLEICKQLPDVQADKEKITWVLMQLIDNAIKFTPKGGEVTVDATPEEAGIKIGVTDTGIGIPKERFNELFEPFHQLDGSESRRYGGTGLGLALVKRIIEAHGSLVKVYSEVGRGSRFEFSLQRVKEYHV